MPAEKHKLANLLSKRGRIAKQVNSLLFPFDIVPSRFTSFSYSGIGMAVENSLSKP